MSRSVKDEGTPEVQARRRWYAGEGGRVELTDYPVGILLANGVIGEKAHTAACRYAWMHAVVYGRPIVAASRYGEERGGTELDERTTEKIKAKLDHIERNLMLKPDSWRQELGRVVIHEALPAWMRPVPPSSVDVRDAANLVAALDHLTEVCHGRLIRVA